MKKSRNTFIAIWAICFALFNLIVFVVPNENREADNFWIGYAIITFALLGNLVSSVIALNSKGDAKVLYNIPLITTSIVEIVISSIAGAIFMTVPGIKSWAVVVVSAVIFAVSAIASLVAKSAADTVGDIDDKIKNKTSFIRSITLDAEMLMTSATTPEIKAEIKKVYEAFRFSDPMSSDVLNDVEDRIQNQFNLLQEVVIAENTDRVSTVAKDLLSLIDYRNKKCKISK